MELTAEQVLELAARTQVAEPEVVPAAAAGHHGQEERR